MNRYALQINIKGKSIARETLFLAGAGLFSLTFLYLYFIQAAVQNGARWGKATAELGILNSFLGARENEYVELRKRITPELAQALGFTEAKESIFIARPALGRTLSISHNEI